MVRNTKTEDHTSEKLPRTVLNFLPARYLVLVTCFGTNQLNKLAYQFAHELFHVFTIPHVIDDDICEAFAVAASLACLEHLSSYEGTDCSWSKEEARLFGDYQDRVKQEVVQHVQDRSGLEAKHKETLVARESRRLLQSFTTTSSTVDGELEKRQMYILAATELVPVLKTYRNWRPLSHLILEIETQQRAGACSDLRTCLAVIRAKGAKFDGDENSFLDTLSDLVQH